MPRNNPSLSHIASARGGESVHNAGANGGRRGGGIGTSRARSTSQGIRLRSASSIGKCRVASLGIWGLTGEEGAQERIKLDIKSTPSGNIKSIGGLYCKKYLLTCPHRRALPQPRSNVIIVTEVSLLMLFIDPLKQL